MKRIITMIQVRAAMIVLLAVFTATTGWAQSLSGSGTSADPYQIGSDHDWEAFAYLINNHNSDYAGKYYKLTADVNVSTMVGTSDTNGFSGTFDGDGHTLTLNLTAADDYCAPFRYSFNNAKYVRLHIAGTITTNYQHAGGLVGYNIGYGASVNNCWSSVTINSNTAKDYCYHGGFLGCNGGGVTFRNCLFDGEFQGKVVKCGGFVGDATLSGASVYNSLFNSTPPSNFSSCDVFSISGLIIDNSYYVQSFGAHQIGAEAVGSRTNEELQACLGNRWEIKDNKVVPILDLKNVASCDITYTSASLYTGSEISVPAVTVTDMDGSTVASSNYTVSMSPSPVKEVGTYTLTITGQNGYNGTATRKYEVLPVLSGKGTEDEPYLIESADDWNLLAQQHEKGFTYGYMKYFKLTEDITVTTMVGTEKNFFRGTFDGSGHTLTVDYTSSDEYAAPFRYVGYSDFKNLHTAGSISINRSSSGLASGLIGRSMEFHVSTIDNCWSSVDIRFYGSGYCYLAGFVASASNFNWLTFKDCLFDGNISVTGTNRAYFAGFTADGSPNKTIFNHCLMAGTLTLPSGNTYSRTFTRSTKPVEYNDSYYTQNVCESNQGTAVDDMTITELATALGEGWTVNDSKAVPVAFDVRNLPGCILLADGAADNSSKLSAQDKDMVMLDGRTLRKNGDWNTICLPFDVTLADSPLAGATAKTLSDASIVDNTVTLSFGADVETLFAGVPYIIRWENGSDIVNPVFKNVTIDATDNSITKDNGNVKFVGYYDAFDIDAANTYIYYMTAGNTLERTDVNHELKACRAYFQFGGNATVRNIVLDFGDMTGLKAIHNSQLDNGQWYDLRGRKLDKQPTKKGLYIFNGNKIVVK